MTSDGTAATAMRDLAQANALAVLDPQPDLLGLPETERRAAIVARRGAGRPPGSRNKRVEDAARFAVEAFGDPLLMLVSLAMTPADELVAAAGCTVLEAMAEKRQAAIAVLPYLHQRKALAVDVSNRKFVHLHVTTGETQSAPEVIEHGVSVQIVESEQYHVVSADGNDAV